MSLREPVVLHRGLLAERASIVLFGDSLTQRGFEEGGWAAALANALVRKADVLNRGFGGYNTRWARAALLGPLFPPRADVRDRHALVTLWFGANDAAVPSESPSVPLEEFAENLEALVSALRLSARHVLLLTPPPVHGATRLAFQRAKYGDDASGVLERTTERAALYAKAAVAVAAKLDDKDARLGAVAVVDVHSAMLRAGADVWPGLVGAGAEGDGLHFSPAGQRFVGRLVLEHVAALGLTDELPLELPLGSQIDPTAYLATMRAHQQLHRPRQIGSGLPSAAADARP